MRDEFGVKLDWLGYELTPEEMAWPEPNPPTPEIPNRPRTPTRLDLAYDAQQMDKPLSNRPKQMRTHNAHEAVELAKVKGVADEVVGLLYRAYWERGEVISDPDVLIRLTDGLLDPAELIDAIRERRYAEWIVGFDDAAYASGVFNVPTFYIGGERYAEATYRTLSRALRAVLDR